MAAADALHPLPAPGSTPIEPCPKCGKMIAGELVRSAIGGAYGNSASFLFRCAGPHVGKAPLGKDAIVWYRSRLPQID